MESKRIRIGDFEFVAANLPPIVGRGSPAVHLAAHALQALDDLKVDCVLVLADSSYSFAATQNKHAVADRVKGIKFVARNPHKVDGKPRHDIYAIRSTS